MGDLNNTEAAREYLQSVADPAYQFRSFAIHPCDDDPAVRKRYRSFLLDDAISDLDWVAKLELATAAKMVETELLSQGKDRLRILVLYGSLRTRFAAAPPPPPFFRRISGRHAEADNGDQCAARTQNSLPTKPRAYSSA